MLEILLQLCSMETTKFYAGNFITTMQYGNFEIYYDEKFYFYVVWKLKIYYRNFILINFIMTMQYENFVLLNFIMRNFIMINLI